MESSQRNSCSVIQYYKGHNHKKEVNKSTSLDNQNSVKNKPKKDLYESSEEESISEEKTNCKKAKKVNADTSKSNMCTNNALGNKPNSNIETEKSDTNICYSNDQNSTSKMGLQINSENSKHGIASDIETKDKKSGKDGGEKLDIVKKEIEESIESDCQSVRKGRKRKLSECFGENDSINESYESGNEQESDSDFDDENADYQPRRRGRTRKNPNMIPTHLSSDMVLGYKILLKFLETPQFSGFHKPFKKSGGEEEDCKITCLNQIKQKFEDNAYTKVCEFVNDVREMLINIYESRNSVAIKKALRLEQILEQRIAQLPNYLRPQCALVLSPEEINNSHNKIRISKGGGFVSLLLEKTEKQRYEKNREKRKLLAEERKQLKEEQDKDVQEWEKNVLLKDYEEEIKSMWELPAIGHFIHLCADILNIGEISQFEIERMLLMPQCSDTLNLVMTALLTNSLVRAKLDRTPSMPYSIWSPLVRTRVVSWYRMWHREERNEQKLFEEIGVEPDFWKILGPERNPLDYYYFHELSLLQRVWVLKSLCDVDFIRKKTVHDNIRAQNLDELNPTYLGLDQQGNRYIQFRQFSNTDLRIYRQSTKLEKGLSPSDLIESVEGFEDREGPITTDKIFKDIWEVNEKVEVKIKNKRTKKPRKYRKKSPPREKISEDVRKNLRRSLRTAPKTYTVPDYSDSESSDSDRIPVKNKSVKQDTLYRPFSDKDFISLNVFRLPRDKLFKTTPKKNSYGGKKAEDSSRNEVGNDKEIKIEKEDIKMEVKSSGCEDEQTNSPDAKHQQGARTELQKVYQGDDMNDDEFDLGEKINNVKLDKSDVNFGIKNLENLKFDFPKTENKICEKNSLNLKAAGNIEDEESSSERDMMYDSLYKYNVPDYLKPDSSKFYLVVDSVEGLRQLISKFGSHENDLEIISRSTKSKKKNDSFSGMSSEVQLIEKLQNLLEELEPWEFDLIKSNRMNKEKMYKEYMSFLNRPPDFVHSNESYWMKTYEEPKSTTTTATTSPSLSTTPSLNTATVTTTTFTTTKATVNTVISSTSSEKDGVSELGESCSLQQENLLELLPRKRTRVTRVQLVPDFEDSDDELDSDDRESNESDDNWVLPTSKKKAKKEAVVKTSKVSRRGSTRKAKSSSANKNDSSTAKADKSNNSSPEKTKKALFWGPRSSDPSEDLNWEKNRQKILEQHNSPMKKMLFRADEIISNIKEFEKAAKLEPDLALSVINSSSKSLGPLIPGNKKPYYSSAQLKEMENQRKEAVDVQNLEASEVTKIEMDVETEDLVVNKANSTVQTYSRIKTAAPNKVMINPQTLSLVGQQQCLPVIFTKVSTAGVSKTSSNEPVKCTQILNKQIQSSSSPINANSQKLPMVEISAEKLSQIQFQQPGNKIQPNPNLAPTVQPIRVKTAATSLGNLKLQQPIHLQPKVMTLQTVGPQGKIIQQVQTQPQVQIQNHPQVQLSNRIQVQGQSQPIIRLENLKGSEISLLEEKSAEGTKIALSSNSEDLYITDGKQLMKFDNNFIEQYFHKDKAAALQEKFDLKKPLLIVKRKISEIPNSNQSQVKPTGNQPNVMVHTKLADTPHTKTTTSASNVVVSGNYIIKNDNQPQTQGQQQAVKVVQQAPAYIIQQKPIVNKAPQSQIIKLLSSQPLSTNQNFVINTSNMNQMIQPMAQNVIETSQQKAKTPSTFRFIRPQNTTMQSNTNPIQGQVIVNNVVQIPNQGLETNKSHTSAGGRVTSAVQAIHVKSPASIQSEVPSLPVSQAVSLRANVNAQNSDVETKTNSQQSQSKTILSGRGSHILKTIGKSNSSQANNQTPRLISRSQSQQIQSQNIIVSSTSNSQFVTPLTNINQQSLRIVTNAQTQAQNRVIMSTSNLSPQCIWKAAKVNEQQIDNNQVQTVISSADLNPQLFGSAQPIRLIANAQPQMQSQTVLVPANAFHQVLRTAPHSVKTNAQQVPVRAIAPAINSTQPVKIISNINSQPVKFVAPNNMGVRFVNKNSPSIKGTVMTNTAQSQTMNMSDVRLSGISGQPIHFQTILPSGAKSVQKPSTVTSVNANTVSPNVIAHTPVIIKTENEENVRFVENNVTEPSVTVDHLHGELSVKKTSQGWKYAVKASNGKDVILTEKQIGERVTANNGVMK